MTVSESMMRRNKLVEIVYPTTLPPHEYRRFSFTVNIKKINFKEFQKKNKQNNI